MAKTMKITAILSLLLTVICTLLHIKIANDIMLTLAITFGTIAYHFCMRLFVGEGINLTFVIMQRYNRPRIIKLIKSYEKGVGSSEKAI